MNPARVSRKGYFDMALTSTLRIDGFAFPLAGILKGVLPFKIVKLTGLYFPSSHFKQLQKGIRRLDANKVFRLIIIIRSKTLLTDC
jgi:hypothetical protein